MQKPIGGRSVMAAFSPISMLKIAEDKENSDGSLLLSSTLRSTQCILESYKTFVSASVYILLGNMLPFRFISTSATLLFNFIH